jgi:PAS domain S-box-containing protein
MSSLVLLITVLCTAGSFLFLQSTLVDRARADLRNTLSGVAGYIDSQQSDLLGEAQLVADDPKVVSAVLRGHRQALTVYLTPYFADLNTDVLDVVDASGRVVVRMENTQAFGDNVSSMPDVRQSLGGASSVAAEADPRSDAGNTGYAIRASVPIRSGSQVVGVVVVGRELNGFFASRIGHALNADINLILGSVRTGTTLTDANGLPETDVREPAAVLARIATGRRSIAQTTDSGHAVLSGILPLSSADGRWIGAAEVIRPLGPLYDVIQTLSFLLAILGVLVVVLGTIIGWSISRRLTVRLSRLESIASHVAGQAEEGERVGGFLLEPVVTGSDEVASLGRSFGAMMLALDARMEENNRLASQQIQEKEDLYRSIFTETSDGLEILDMAGTIVEVNEAACAMHGYTHDEMVGIHVTELTVPENRVLLEGDLERLEHGRTTHNETMGRRKDGSLFFAEARGSTLIYRGDPHVLVVVRDITERVHAYELLEQRVRERTRELTTLLDVSHNVASTLELRPLIELVLDQLKAVVEYSGATILLVQDDALVAVARRLPDSSHAEANDSYEVEAASAILDRIRPGRPLIIGDVRDDSEEAGDYRQAVGDRINSAYFYERGVLVAPMMLKDTMLGALVLASDRPGFFTEEHAMLTAAVATQAAIAIENARLYEQAQEVAVLEERQRLARELHDSVSQALYGIALGAKTARALLDRDPAMVSDPLEYVLQQAAAGLAEMRALIFELRPDALQTEGLIAALEKQVESMRARHGLQVNALFCSEPKISFPAKEALYRIAQEGMHNTVKHARATVVDVKLDCSADGVTLELSDNGRGFNPNGSFPGHLGLQSMRERAVQLGGSLDVESSPGTGTRIHVRIPATKRLRAAG